MFHRLLIAAALAVGAPAIGAAVAPELGIGQAQVKFTGKIKRIRIKKTRVGSGRGCSASTCPTPSGRSTVLV